MLKSALKLSKFKIQNKHKNKSSTFSFLLKTGLLGLVALLFSFNGVLAQTMDAPTELPKNNVYAEATVGAILHATVNYERRFYSGEKVSWYGRLGAGAGGVIIATGGQGGLAAVTMLTGKKNSHFEFNAGALIGYDRTYNSTFGIPILKAGYRYEKPTGGLLFRANAGLFALGVGLGYSF